MPAGRNLISSALPAQVQALCPKGFTALVSSVLALRGPAATRACRLGSGHCFAGYYCPQQSEHPIPCPDGHWCDGNSSVLCPAGRYGAPGTEVSSTPGFTHVKSSLLGTDACTGSCAPGHYCPPGSTSPTQARCPPGTYGGLEGGLGSAACSGLCHPGYYCPGDGKSINATRFACADVSPGTHLDWDEDGVIDDGLPQIQLSGDGEVSSVYCPEGSGRPVRVSEGSRRRRCI